MLRRKPLLPLLWMLSSVFAFPTLDGYAVERPAPPNTPVSSLPPSSGSRTESEFHETIDTHWGALKIDSHGCRSQRINLGKRLTGSRIAIDWSLHNDSDTNLTFASSNTTCGCISPPPKQVQVAAAKSFEHSFALELPKIPGKLQKQIAFFSEGGLPVLELNLDVDVVPPVELPSVLQISEDRVAMLDVPITFHVPAEQAGQYVVTVTGQEVVKSEQDSKKKLLRLSLTPDLNPATKKSQWRAMISCDGQTVAQYDMELQYSHRIATLPGQLILKKSGDALVGSVIILREPTPAAESSLQYRATLQDAMGKPLSCTVRLTVADDKVSKRQTLRFEIPILDATLSVHSIHLECGEWKKSLPCTIVP